jgi:hypothetical protein
MLMRLQGEGKADENASKEGQGSSDNASGSGSEETTDKKDTEL